MHVPDDGGHERNDAASGGTGVATVRLGERAEGLPSNWQLQEAYVSLGELRVDSDRGGSLEPRWTDPGRLRLDEEPPEQHLDAAPATYGGLMLSAVDGSDLGFELVFRAQDHAVSVRSTRSTGSLTLRCMEGAVGLRPGGSIVLEASLDVATIAERLDAEPPDGDVEIDSETDPTLVQEIEGLFDRAWTLHCQGGG